MPPVQTRRTPWRGLLSATAAPVSTARSIHFVSRDDDSLAAALDRLRGDGATIVPWDALPVEPWTLTDANFVATGTVTKQGYARIFFGATTTHIFGAGNYTDRQSLVYVGRSMLLPL